MKGEYEERGTEQNDSEEQVRGGKNMARIRKGLEETREGKNEEEIC